MKKLYLLLAFIIIMSVGCSNNNKPNNEANTQTNKQENIETAVEQNTQPTENKEEIKQTTYVVDADYSTEMCTFPFIDENELGDIAKEVNAEIKEWSQEFLDYELMNPDSGIDYLVDYKYHYANDILSICIKYLHIPKSHSEYKTYTVNTAEKRIISIHEAFDIAGIDISKAAKQVEAFAISDYMNQLDRMAVLDFETLTTPEVYVEEVRGSFEIALKDDSLPFYLGEDGPEVFVYTFLIEHNGFTPQKAITIGNYYFETAYRSAQYDQLIAIRKNAEEEEVSKMKIVKKLKSDIGDFDKIYYTATKDNTDISFDLLKYENDELKVKSNIYSGQLNKGETISLATVIPEGIPNIRVSVSADNLNYSEEVYFNGLLDDSKICLPICEDPHEVTSYSKTFYLANAKIIGEKYLNNEFGEDDMIWNSIFSAVDLTHGFFNNDSINVSRKTVEEYMNAMYPERDSLPKLDGTGLADIERIKYDNENNEYTFRPFEQTLRINLIDASEKSRRLLDDSPPKPLTYIDTLITDINTGVSTPYRVNVKYDGKKYIIEDYMVINN